jgi:hypothetical protein
LITETKVHGFFVFSKELDIIFNLFFNKIQNMCKNRLKIKLVFMYFAKKCKKLIKNQTCIFEMSKKKGSDKQILFFLVIFNVYSA